MDAVTYQTYLHTSGKVAALASLLFAGIALLVAEYAWSSFLQLAVVPLVYALPPPETKSSVAVTTGCVLLELVVFVVCLAAGESLSIGTDAQCGALALISVGLMADAAVHECALRHGQGAADEAFRHLEKVVPA